MVPAAVPGAEMGGAAMNDALGLIARCEDEGHWPGYEATVRALNLPAWAYGKGVGA
jgi:hypothetical protein